MSVKPKVISIAAVSGGGKTAVTNALNQTLGDSRKLLFDEYDFHESPDDLIQWVEEGADYNEWNLEPLIKDIQQLSTLKEAPAYIVIDYPFAYRNYGMRNLIDVSVYIDTPLDVAMGRRILRDFSNDNSASDIQENIRLYLDSGRRAYLEMEKTIKPDSDLVIDGTLPVERIVESIVEILTN
nr:hypothetical protein [Bacillus sp. SG-1]